MDDAAGADEGDWADGAVLQEAGRRVRSTRRRHDVVDRPSMFVTLTLGSYGPIVPGTGTPARPHANDYRAQQWRPCTSRLFDRWMQNLRRCAGYRVQYFGAVEPQRRLAPHMHVALRGAIPRRVIRTVTQATYLQLWWPSFESPVHADPGAMPAWNATIGRVVDCHGVPLRSWEEALDELDADAAADPPW